MVGMEKRNDRFPAVEWQEPWPQDRSLRGVVLPLIFALLFFALAGVMVAMVPLRAGWIPLTGAWGAALMMLSATVVFVSPLLRLLPRRESGVRSHVDGTHGAGIRLTLGRFNQVVSLCTIAGASSYGFCSWLDWRAGGSHLLPLSKSNQAGATWILILASVLAAVGIFLAISFRWMLTVEIYPTGLVRRTALPFGRSREEFVAWRHITRLNPTSFVVYKSTNPIIEIEHSDLALEPRSRVHDRPGVLGLVIHLARCNLNALFSIVEYLKDHEESRSLLTSPDAPQWFLDVERRGRELQRAGQTKDGER